MNEKLKKAIRLDKKIVLYIPATMGAATACDNSAAVDAAAAFLSGLFGGATIQPCRGAWLSDSVGLVLENTTLIYAFTDPASYAAALDSVVDYAEKIKLDMQQESVSIELDGALYLI